MQLLRFRTNVTRAQQCDYLARMTLIFADHLLDLSKPHSLVDLRIWLIATGLQIALSPLCVRSVGNVLEEKLANALALLIRQDCDNVAEVVTLWVGPKF